MSGERAVPVKLTEAWRSTHAAAASWDAHVYASDPLRCNVQGGDVDGEPAYLEGGVPQAQHAAAEDVPALFATSWVHWRSSVASSSWRLESARWLSASWRSISWRVPASSP